MDRSQHYARNNANHAMQGAATNARAATNANHAVQAAAGIAFNARATTDALPPDVFTWSEADVRAFFTGCKFPVGGLEGNYVDGGALVELFRDKNAKETFCEAPPLGFGFNNILFRDRFKQEMNRLLGVKRSKEQEDRFKEEMNRVLGLYRPKKVQ